MALRVPLQGRAQLTRALKPAGHCLSRRFLCTSRPALNYGMLNHRQEDRLHRVRSDEPGCQTSASTIRKLKANRPQVFLTAEQRTLLNSLKQSKEAMDWEAALGALNQIPPNAGADWLPIYRAILNCVCRALRYDEAQMVWRSLPARDVMSYNDMIGMCSRLQKFDELDALLQQMQAEGIERTGITYCQMMSSCAESQRWTEALELLGELKSKPAMDATTNWEVAYLMSMTSCARAGQSEQVRALLNELRECGKDAQVQNSHYNALIVSCGNDGGEAAQRAFQEMKDAGLKPRAPDWRALLTCNRDPKEQQRLYQLMRQEMPGAPLEESWAVLLRTAVNLEDWPAADWVLQEMRANGCDPESGSSATPSLRRALGWYAVRQQRMQSMQHMGEDASWPPASSSGSSFSPSSGSSFAAQAPSFPSPPATPQEAPLPSGWDSAVDPNSGRSYYWRSDNPAATTTWERPM